MIFHLNIYFKNTLSNILFRHISNTSSEGPIFDKSYMHLQNPSPRIVSKGNQRLKTLNHNLSLFLGPFGYDYITGKNLTQESLRKNPSIKTLFKMKNDSNSS